MFRVWHGGHLPRRRRRPIMGWSGPCFCPTNDGCCESAVLRALDVAFGSKTEVAALRRGVCFAPVSGHRQAVLACPQSANTGSDYFPVWTLTGPLVPNWWRHPPYTLI